MNSIIKAVIPYVVIFGVANALGILILLAYVGRLKDAPAYLFSLAAVVTFGLVLYLIFDDRGWVTLSATIIVFILCVVFAYFPQLDSLSAGMVSVKLGRELDRAEELFQRLKSLAGINARVTYSVISWNGRIEAIPTQEKQDISDQIDKELRSYGHADSEIATIKGHFVRFIGIDLVRTFEYALENHVNNTEWSAAWNARARLGLRKLGEMSASQLGAYLKAEIPAEHLAPMDAEKFSRFADRLASLYEGCVAKGGYTPETIAFLNEIYPLFGQALAGYVLK